VADSLNLLPILNQTVTNQHIPKRMAIWHSETNGNLTSYSALKKIAKETAFKNKPLLFHKT